MKTPPTTIAELRKALPKMWFAYTGQRDGVYYNCKGVTPARRMVLVVDITGHDDRPASRREIIAAAYAAARAVDKADE